MKKVSYYIIFLLCLMLTNSHLLQAESPELTPVGHWGTGEYVGVVVQGSYAYCLVKRTGLEIIKISNPQNPIKVGELAFDVDEETVRIRGNYLYTTSRDGFKVIDISHPSSPKLIGTADSWGTGLVINGNYAYTSSWNQLYTIDISNPSQPVRVNSRKVKVSLRELCIKDNYLYAVNYGNTLSVINLSIPSEPLPVNYITLPVENCLNIVSKGNHLHIIHDKGGLVLDTVDPLVPEIKRSWQMNIESDDSVLSIAGNYLYLGINSDLHIIDIANPDAPLLRGQASFSNNVLSVHVNTNTLYGVSGLGGLQLFDVTDADRPVETGRYDRCSVLKDIQVKGKYAYLAGSSPMLAILDISGPVSGMTINPVQIGSFANNQGSAEKVRLVGNNAYLFSQYGLIVVDVSNPQWPVEKGRYILDREMLASAFFVGDNYAYILAKTNDGTQVQVINVSDPKNLKIVGVFSYADSYEYNDLYVVGKYLYWSRSGYFDDVSTMVVYVADPTNPVLVKSVDIGTIRWADEHQRFAYASQKNKMQVVVLSIPASPALFGQYSSNSAVESIHVNGGYAFIGNYNNMKIIDISNPAKPVEAGIHYKFSTQIMEISDNILYRLNSGKVFMYRIHEPRNPILTVKSYPYSDAEISATVDKYGFGDGESHFNRTYNPGQKVRLTAPLSHRLRFFSKWLLDDEEAGSNRTLEILMDQNHTAKAIYETRDNIHKVTISAHPATYQTEIHVSPLDLAGEGDGTSFFSRYYQTGTIVTLTAPAAAGGAEFLKWKLGDTEYSNNTIQVVITDKTNIIAYYQQLPTYYALAVRSSVGTGVNITASPADKGGLTSNTTNFTFIYLEETEVTLTAPATFAGAHFIKWTLNGETASSNFTQTITMDQSHTAMAHYEALPAGTPKLVLNKTSFYLGADKTGNRTAAQILYIENAGQGTLNWTATATPGWLSVEPSSGTGSGIVTIALDQQVNTLAQGTYSAQLTVSDLLAENSPQTVNITVNVYSSTSSPLGVMATPKQGSTVSGSIAVTGWALDDIGIQSVKIYKEAGLAAPSLEFIGDAVFVEGARPDVEAAYPGFPNNGSAGWGYMMLTNRGTRSTENNEGRIVLHAIATDLEGNSQTLGTTAITIDNTNALKPFGAIDTPEQGGIVSGQYFANQAWVLAQPGNTIPIDGSTIDVWVDGVKLGHPTYNIFRRDIFDLFPNYENSGGAAGYLYLDTTSYTNGVHTIVWTATDDAGNSDGIGSRYFTIRNSSNRTGNGSMDLSLLAPQTMETITINSKPFEPIVIHFFANETGGVGSKQSITNISPLPVGSSLDRESGVFSWIACAGFMGNYRFTFLVRSREGELFRREVIVTISPEL